MFVRKLPFIFWLVRLLQTSGLSFDYLNCGSSLVIRNSCGVRLAKSDEEDLITIISEEAAFYGILMSVKQTARGVMIEEIESGSNHS